MTKNEIIIKSMTMWPVLLEQGIYFLIFAWCNSAPELFYKLNV